MKLVLGDTVNRTNQDSYINHMYEDHWLYAMTEVKIEGTTKLTTEISTRLNIARRTCARPFLMCAPLDAIIKLTVVRMV